MNILALNAVAASAVATVALPTALGDVALSLPPPEDHFVSAPSQSVPPGDTIQLSMSLPSPSALLLVYGGLAAAKIFPRPATHWLVTMMGTVGALRMATTEHDLSSAVEIYLAGCVTLRLIKHWNVQPFGKPKVGQDPFAGSPDPSAFPRLHDLYGRDNCYTKAVDQLGALLREHPRLAHFFNFNPDRQKLLDEIGWVRMSPSKDRVKIGAYEGIFVPVKGAVYAPEVVEVVLHELTHVLHFTAARRRLTFPDLQRIVKFFEKGIVFPSLFNPVLETLRHFMEGKERSPGFIPEEVRHAAAVLGFLIAAMKRPSYLESLATFFQIRLNPSLRRVRERVLSITTPLMGWIFIPMAWIGGVLWETPMLNQLVGYHNPFILRRVLKLGPIDSLLGPKLK